MSKPPPWCVLATWLCLWLCAARPAFAEDSTVVLFEMQAGAHPPHEAVLEAARGQLAEIGVRLAVAARPNGAELAQWTAHARAEAEAAGAIGVVWLESRQRTTLVYLYDARAGRLLSRSIAVSGSPAAAAEEVAIVLRSAIGALLDGAEIVMTEVPVRDLAEPVEAEVAREVAAEPAVPRAKTDFGLLALGVGYTTTVLGEGGDFQDGTRLAVAVRAGERWAFGAAYGFFPAQRSSTDAVTTRIERHPAEVFAGFDVLADVPRAGPELALVVDALERRTERADAPFSAEPDSTRWTWAAALRLRIQYEVVHRLRVHSALGAEIVLNPFDQEVVDASGGREKVFSLSPVRPTLEVGLAFGVF